MPATADAARPDYDTTAHTHNTSTSQLHEALACAARGWPVFPCWPTRPGGICTCNQSGGCKHAGKHPLTPNGCNDATCDVDQIRRWWRQWPDANVAVSLEPAGLVDIAPDSPAALERFRSLGLPRTVTFESGSGAGHQHHLYQRPGACPTTRICHSGDFDLMAAGYALLPPSRNGVGAYHWLVTPDEVGELPTVPRWAVDQLQAHEHTRDRIGTDRGSTIWAGDPPVGCEPPVRLVGAALRRWHGEDDGFTVTDRSGRLKAIAGDLARANASVGTIILALRERDQALGWSKYTDRDDADVRYAELAHSVVEFESEPPDVETANADLLRLLARIDATDDLYLSATDKQLAHGLVRLFRSHESRGETKPLVVYRATLRDQTGLTVAQVGSSLKRMAERGLIEKQPNQQPGALFARGYLITLTGGSVQAFVQAVTWLDVPRRRRGGRRSGAGCKSVLDRYISPCRQGRHVGLLTCSACQQTVCENQNLPTELGHGETDVSEPGTSTPTGPTTPCPFESRTTTRTGVTVLMGLTASGDGDAGDDVMHRANSQSRPGEPPW